MNEIQFWSIIEDAWFDVGSWNQERRQLTAGQLPEEKLDGLVNALDEFIPALRARLQSLSQDDLLAFDRILERKLWDIDRAEIQEITHGSNDGFLYARGFIVAAGQAFYEAVNTAPARARSGVECEEMCYLSYHVYLEKFGDVFPLWRYPRCNRACNQ